MPVAVAADECLGQTPTITGTAGDDVIFGTPQNDVIAGGSGFDVIRAGTGDDLICGGDGGDVLYGGRGNDQVSGEGGQDVLHGGPGFDKLEGGGQSTPGVAGGDAVSYAGASAGVDVSLRLNRGGPVGQDRDHISGVFTLVGSDFNDVVFGARDHANRILGRGGNDFIVGNSYADVLNGDEGTDQISGGGGGDTVSGGPGNDFLQGADPGFDLDETVSYQDATGPVHVDLASGVATGEGTDTFSGFSNILGSPFDDLLQGDEKANTISGEAGSDSISGRAGGDTLYGYDLDPDGSSAQDRDTVVGGTGIDLVIGGPGDDTLDVQDGAGVDTVSGLVGVDDCSYDPGDNVFGCP
jgi:Ca2+-binding RTX toxin-like protein